MSKEYLLLLSFPGIEITFSRTLRPKVAGYVGEEVGEWWVFEKEGKINEYFLCMLIFEYLQGINLDSQQINLESEDSVPDDALTAVKDGQSALSPSGSNYSTNFDEVHDELFGSPTTRESRPRLYQGTPTTPSARPVTSSTSTSSTPTTRTAISPSTPTAKLISSLPVTPTTVHQNPDWLKTLVNNFQSEIIDACSSRTKIAAKNDEYVQV